MKPNPTFYQQIIPKTALDKIFGNERPLCSEKAMKKAGFFKYKQSDKDIIVTGHPRLVGYIIKTYLDTSGNQDWVKWIERINGANRSGIASIIMVLARDSKCQKNGSIPFLRN